MLAETCRNVLQRHWRVLVTPQLSHTTATRVPGKPLQGPDTGRGFICHVFTAQKIGGHNYVVDSLDI